MTDEWLALREAAVLLGVHPRTVRIWSDKGLLPVYRTRGGHRRYKQSEVELWARTSRDQPAIDPERLVHAAVRNIRLQISEGRLEAETWYQKLDDAARDQYRGSAHTLFQGLGHYLAAGSGAEDGIPEAHSIGYEYASRARRFGLNSVDAARAFLFFRDVLLGSVIQVYQEANVPSGRAWGDMLRRVNAFTDLILLQLLETYRAMERA